MVRFDFNHIGSRLSTETRPRSRCGTGFLNFNHIGSRLSTETDAWREVAQPRRRNFNHIGSRLSTETLKGACSRRSLYRDFNHIGSRLITETREQADVNDTDAAISTTSAHG